jgi:hypothetical protein
VEKIRLEILGLSASHSQSGSFALVLGEELGDRRLPIIIGMFEAQAIAVEMEKITSNRPMTHDLFKSFAGQFDIEILEIIISHLREGVFYAQIICQFRDGSRRVELDARPSDAIAIGLRFGVPLYAYESVMKEAGVVLDEIAPGEEKRGPGTVVSAEAAAKPASLSEIGTEQLQEMMQQAIEQEDYERAAKIRDELGRRE